MLDTSSANGTRPPPIAMLPDPLPHDARPVDCAERGRVSINTIRMRMKRWFAKTGTRGQAHLMRLAFTGRVAALRRP